MDDRLDLMDQGSFLGLRALGHQPCTLLTWVYERPVDLDELGRFNERLARTLLGRLVQRSPVPGGRHRWVAVASAPPLEIEPGARPREAVQDWTEELGDRGVDPEHGPGWRVGVLPLTDGGTAVTLVTGHTLGDGLCKLQAVADAVQGVERRPAHPARGMASRRTLVLPDLVELLRSLPAVVRAAVAGIRVARAQASSGADRGREWRRSARHSASGGPDRATRAAACVRVDQAAWDAAAERRGGTSNTLVSALAARLGDRLDRRDAQGRVTLAVPVSTRVAGDTRANALDSASVVIDPNGLGEDLTGLRASTKRALAELAERSHELAAVLPLIALTPAFVVRHTETIAMGSAAAPVGCSNHGDVDPAVLRIDGAEPDDFWVRLTEPGQTEADLDRIGGQLYVLSGRALGRVYLSVAAYRVGGGPDREQLHDLVAATLAEFGLTVALVTA